MRTSAWLKRNRPATLSWSNHRSTANQFRYVRAPLQNTLLGALVGLMLSIGVVFLIEYLDDRSAFAGTD